MKGATAYRHPRSTLSLTVLLATLLAGCGGDFDDLHALTQRVPPQVDAQAPPTPVGSVSVAYRSAHKRSPFMPAVTVPKALDDTGAPDRNRIKGPLERFPLDQLRMVGTLAIRERMFALVRDPAGATSRIGTGDYLGMDHGRVVIVREAGVEFVETVRDGTGGWIQRRGSLLVQQSAARSLPAEAARSLLAEKKEKERESDS